MCVRAFMCFPEHFLLNYVLLSPHQFLSTLRIFLNKYVLKTYLQFLTLTNNSLYVKTEISKMYWSHHSIYFLM